MKITIVGYSGSGKSTLAKSLAEKYNCEVLHLDSVHWLPGWVERNPGEEVTIVGDFLDGHESWVIDGNYSRLHYERRLQESDLIIEMLFDRFTCYRRAWKRLKTYRGKTRPDMTEGCNEKIDWEFTQWIFFGGRVKKTRQNYKRILQEYPEKTVVIRNQRQLDRFMSEQGMEKSLKEKY